MRTEWLSDIYIYIYTFSSPNLIANLIAKCSELQGMKESTVCLQGCELHIYIYIYKHITDSFQRYVGVGERGGRGY